MNPHDTPRSPGRREANKACTREAIVTAVQRLLTTEGLATMTAERVADEAGISRRTFFNYFPSIEAVMAHRAQVVMDRVGAMLASRPAGEPLTESLRAVVEEVFTVDLLIEATAAWQDVGSSPEATRHALARHEESLTELVTEWTRTRLPGREDDDPLRVEVTLAASMAAFEVARRHWMAGHTGPIDRTARDAFVATVRRAFGVLGPLGDGAGQSAGRGAGRSAGRSAGPIHPPTH